MEDNYQKVNVKIHNYDEEYHNFQVSFSNDSFDEPDGSETLFNYDIGNFKGTTMEEIMKELSIMGYYEIKRMTSKKDALQKSDVIAQLKNNVGNKISNDVGHLEAALAVTLPGYAVNDTLVEFLPSFDIEKKNF